MAYTPEELYVIGLMAKDAAMGRDGASELTEYQSNEAAVFAAMAMDKENRQQSSFSNDTKSTAKLIYSRVSGLLQNPQNVRDVYVGMFGNDVINHPSEDTLKDICNVGYYMLRDRTNYAETQHALDITVRDLKAKGFEEEAQTFVDKSAEIEQAMLDAALPVIEYGLLDGSISSSLAYKSDEEIVQILANSDGTKEAEIQEGFSPAMYSVYKDMARAKFEAECKIEDGVQDDYAQ